MSKILMPAAVISTIGYSGYTYQNTQNSVVSSVQPEVAALQELDLTPGDTEFDKLVSRDVKFSNDTTLLLSENETTNNLLKKDDNPMQYLKRIAVGKAGVSHTSKNPLRCLLNHPRPG